MAKIFRRAANKVINSRDGHGSLGLLIFDEKVVCESFQKLIIAKANASLTMLKWAKNEENLALQDVFSKVFEVSTMWTTVMKDFTEEYHKYRKSFKEVLQQEKVLDESRKREAVHVTKMNKIQKQLDQNKKKNDRARPRTISNEVVEARKLRESLSKISDGLHHWASKTISVAETYKKLADLITDTPTHLSESKVFHGAGQSRSIVNDLARQICINPELSAQLAAMSQSTRPYLYAVSRPVKQDSAKYHYAELNAATSDQKPSKMQVTRHAPQPLPYQHLVDQHVRRPLSLNDLRPPPTSPPPPLPKSERPVVFRTNSAKESIVRKTKMNSRQSTGKIWYASTNISSDSDSDSDGYTEPVTDASFFEGRNKMLCKVLSDGAINKVGLHNYASRETGYASTSTNFYHQLEKGSSGEDVFIEENESGSYIDVINN
ncbi:hypothetical protein AWC38_SpisGene19878 [Stylophora pistillata]|uniref:Uncharacterized protein n=1 Tax=Stylophora pistillata TaxID=50429 RepID=A0A2B4RHK4_STYPI|nr:hypothetical protein AWC38_SpisGene19878 [Stylophora pistillata]